MDIQELDELCQNKRPNVSVDLAITIARECFGKTADDIKELKSHTDRNFYISEGATGKEYVLKVFVRKNGQTGRQDLDNATKVMFWLTEKGFTVPQPTPGINNSFVQHYYSKNGTGGEREHLAVALLSYVNGDVLNDHLPLSGQTLYELGSLLADLQISLQMLNLPGLEEESERKVWRLENLPTLKRYIKFLNSEEKRTMIRDGIAEFESMMKINVESLEKGVVHADFHDGNVLSLALSNAPAGQDDQNYLKGKYGILDFGDVCLSAYLFDLATGLALYMMSASVDDFIGHGSHFLDGYMAIRKLSQLELDLLYTSVCSSYCKELLLCEYDYVLQNGKNEYLMTSSRTGWNQLEQLISIGKDKIMEKWNIV